MKTILTLLIFFSSFLWTAVYSIKTQIMTSEWTLFLALFVTSLFHLWIYKERYKRVPRY